MKLLTPTGFVPLSPTTVSADTDSGDDVVNFIIDVPSSHPSMSPTPKPTPYPTAKPTPYPTAKPTPYPTPYPTPMPTMVGTICGFVKLDTDNDDEGEVLVDGVTIKLIGDDHKVIGTVVTGGPHLSKGQFCFKGLVAGTYKIMEENPSGVFDVSDSDGGDPNKITVTIGGGKPFDSLDNLFIDEPKRSISGKVLEDTDEDGDGDVPVDGAKVQLFDEHGRFKAETKTSHNGSYSFTGLEPGDYTVKLLTPTGFVPLSPTTVSADINSGDRQVNFVIDVPSSHPSMSPTPKPTPYPTAKPTPYPTPKPTPKACIPSKRVFFDSFEHPSDYNGWSNAKRSHHPNFSNFLGRYDEHDVNNAPEKKYDPINPHASGVKIEVAFYEIDSWDKDTKYGPDEVNVFINDVKISIGAYSNYHDDPIRSGTTAGIRWSSRSSGAPKHLGYNPYFKDQKHILIFAIPPHYFKDGWIKLKLQAVLNGSAHDESAGWDNIRIYEQYPCHRRLRGSAQDELEEEEPLDGDEAIMISASQM